jgi:hypothetical protein
MLLGTLVVVGLSACGQAADGETEFQNARISRNSDSTMTLTDGQRTIDVTSVTSPEQSLTSGGGEVNQMLQKVDVCCTGCDCQNGSCTCTECHVC